jgi:hypothetical protein
MMVDCHPLLLAFVSICIAVLPETLGLHPSLGPTAVALPEWNAVSRRSFFSSVMVATSASVMMLSDRALAASPLVDRNELLQAIARNSPDQEVINIIEKLTDPCNGKATTYPERLDGQWELIWSYKAEAFSPLLKLPRPFRPESYQYLGSAAAAEVGDGRIAQGLTGGILGNNQLWLSSGALPYPADLSVLEIQPPFRFQLGGRFGTGVPKKTIVEAGSDAAFRQVNLRNKAEQEAGKNQYKQIYLENLGPGSLRVSSVIAGDPVIVGEIFIHRKL